VSEPRTGTRTRRRSLWKVWVLLVWGLAGSSAIAAPLPDPTRPLVGSAEPTRVAPAPAATVWDLSAIIFSPERRIAMINGQPVAEGERIGGARVVKIAVGGVLLWEGSREFTLRLLPVLREDSVNPAPKMDGVR
jgi:MSHA biogenesis protein MshK